MEELNLFDIDEEVVESSEKSQDEQEDLTEHQKESENSKEVTVDDNLGIFLNWFADKIDLPKEERDNLSEDIVDEYFFNYQQSVTSLALQNLPAYLQKPIEIALNEQLSESEFMDLVQQSKSVNTDVSSTDRAKQFISSYLKETEELDDDEVEERISFYEDKGKNLTDIAKKIQEKLGISFEKKHQASLNFVEEQKKKEQEFIQGYSNAIKEFGFRKDLSDKLTNSLTGKFKNTIEDIFKSNPKAAMQLVLLVETGFDGKDFNFERVLSELKPNNKQAKTISTALQNYKRNNKESGQVKQNKEFNIDLLEVDF